jgi:hypothetical protein
VQAFNHIDNRANAFMSASVLKVAYVLKIIEALLQRDARSVQSLNVERGCAQP